MHEGANGGGVGNCEGVSSSSKGLLLGERSARFRWLCGKELIYLGLKSEKARNPYCGARIERGLKTEARRHFHPSSILILVTAARHISQ